ncbi:uncharacterized protein LOC134717620 [Mytilus trossulus]|uniref:uncharacterized protein LOC134717620 n=1 Tax=Mytilus trossulus TaxID=6551 RepID=UPI003005D1C9
MSLNFQILLVVLVGFTGKSSQQVVINIDDIVGQGVLGNIDEVVLINEGSVSSSQTNTCDGTFLGGVLLGRLLAPMAMADGSTMTPLMSMLTTLMSMLTGVPQTPVPMVCPPQSTTTPCPSTPPQRTVNRVILCEGDVPAFISCDSQINIVGAVYGRVDPSICPDPRISTTSCISTTSDALVKTDCNGQTICQLIANNGKFGDPCPGGSIIMTKKIMTRRTMNRKTADLNEENIDFLRRSINENGVTSRESTDDDRDSGKP